MKKLSEVNQAILHSGVRWSINILAELGGNYARMMPKWRAKHLTDAINSLHRVIGPETTDVEEG